MKRILPLLLAAIVIFSGCASKRNYNKAQKFDDAGLYTDAANLYFKSLSANKNNIDAKLGLQRTGQMVLEDKVDAFKAKYSNGTAKEAVYAYREAEGYYEQLSALGVKLIISDEQKEYYLEVKDKYLDILYQQASKALSLDEFSSAEAQFGEILSIDKNFKDTQSLWITAKYEPVYRHGEQLISTSSYRSAYADFTLINKNTKGYKNSIELQARCLDSATISIAVLPFSYTYPSYNKNSSIVKTSVINGINNIKSPFYKIISDEAIRSMPEWQTIRDESLAIKYARRINTFEAKSILSATIEKQSAQKGSLQRKEKHGYLKQETEVVNPETKLKERKTTYKKVRYYEYTQVNKAVLSVNYKLNRIDTDELAVSDQFYAEEEDRIHYARFDGNYKNLVAGAWKHISKESSSDRVYDSSESNKELRKLFNNKKEIVSVSQLEKKLLDNCAKKIATSISNYKPEN